jgi:hypothetical protein
MRRPGTLIGANIAFVAANLLHTADHQRQGTERLATEILVGGTLLTIAAVASLVLALRRDDRAPIFAAVVGLSGAAGIAASHIAPHWSALSDSYPAIGADAVSWAVMLVEIGGALLLAFAAVRAMRSTTSVHSSDSSLRAAVSGADTSGENTISGGRWGTVRRTP